MRTGSLLSVLVLGIAGSGCTSMRESVAAKLSSAPRPTSPVAVVDHAPSQKQEPELPPDQAATACRKTAEELAARGFPAEAIEHYEHARRLDPRSTEVAHRLAVLYARTGEPDRAIAEFEKAVAHTPRNPDVLTDYGVFCIERDDLPAAERHLRAALDATPDHAGAWANLGVMYAKSDRPDEARQAFAKVMPASQAAYNVGVILAGRGRTAEARVQLREAASADPPSAKATALLAKLEQVAADSSVR